MTKYLLKAAFFLLALGGPTTSAYAESQGQFGASGAYHFKNSSFMAQGRYIKPLSPKTRLVPAVAFDFDLEEAVLDLDLHIINPGTRYYGIGGINYGDSDTGLNFGIGMNFNYNEKTKGFGELKYIFFGWSGFVLSVGALF
ncbi:hypothetical protein [Kaarinaea lacus]